MSKKFNTAVIAGKFFPPHLGHHYLIDSALKQSDHVDVLVVDNPCYSIPAEQRKSWLQARHPTATIHVIPDIELDDDSLAWAAHTMQFLGYAPDAVFSSEEYGKEWARYMGATHVMVDFDRISIPISATKVRSDIIKNWDFLSNEVKEGMAIRIVVVGAESTGTTTLATDLATALKVPWVPEIGRYYTHSLKSSGQAWTNDDFIRIGKLQQQYEAAMAATSDGIVVCDTNATATELWQRRYMGKTTPEMHKVAVHDKVDLYIITGDEIPFVQDGIRDGEHLRHTMHTWFVRHITSQDVPFIIVRGTPEQRLNDALAESKRIIHNRKTVHGI
jgi:NadR type nicotinamide-nucleotide adenylyltransferase